MITIYISWNETLVFGVFIKDLDCDRYMNTVEAVNQIDDHNGREIEIEAANGTVKIIATSTKQIDEKRVIREVTDYLFEEGLAE